MPLNAICLQCAFEHPAWVSPEYVGMHDNCVVWCITQQPVHTALPDADAARASKTKAGVKPVAHLDVCHCVAPHIPPVDGRLCCPAAAALTVGQQHRPRRRRCAASRGQIPRLGPRLQPWSTQLSLTLAPAAQAAPGCRRTSCGDVCSTVNAHARKGSHPVRPKNSFKSQPRYPGCCRSALAPQL